MRWMSSEQMHFVRYRTLDDTDHWENVHRDVISRCASVCVCVCVMSRQEYEAE